MIALLLVLSAHAGGEETLLSDIAKGGDKYRGGTITLKLRLKNIDLLFGKITFYDRKNHDIAFDIAGLREDPKFLKDTERLHEGMEYLVTFTVRRVKEDGQIEADLAGFAPALLRKLPDRG